MRISQQLAFASALVAVPTIMFACDDDPGQDSPSVGVTASSGAGATTTTSTGNPTSSSTGVMKPMVDFPCDVATDTMLSADNDYLLKGTCHVNAGATLTIEPGTWIFGEAASKGTLVVSRGGRIVADGTADAPIVFTSEKPVGSRAPGDWGGLVILGNAPINEAGGESSIEGFTTMEMYGGTDPADSSGILKYVRIEFSGVEIGDGNEINGLTMGAVGSGTEIDHIMVHHTLDDCFEFFGGTVNASHLVCYRNGDDAFDMDEGYVGSLQFLFFQADPNHPEEDNGLEIDNDDPTSTNAPITSPTVYNVTLCGQGQNQDKQQYGMLLRRGMQGEFGNIIVTGFEAGADIRNAPTTQPTITNSIFFGNAPENIAYVEDGSNMDTQVDDDNGFDDRAWFTAVTSNSTSDPMLGDCLAETPDPMPAATLPGGAPPNNGFLDTTANYVGAFKDASDNWMSGAWIDWSQD
jgi:hypothetical protein